MASVVSLNISKVKGVAKTPVSEVRVSQMGIVDDAHAGNWHRQISLLPIEQIRDFETELGRSLLSGEFGENITTEGIDFSQIAVRDTLTLGDVVLEVTQLGKTCHGTECAIFSEAGKCIMPQHGVFCRVVEPGRLRVGDALAHHQRPLKIMVLTLSDRASQGEYKDRSGPAIVEMLKSFFSSTPWHLQVDTAIIGDDATLLRYKVNDCVAREVDVLLTTGGTGIGKRDITPETLLSLFHKEIPGIMDFIRMKYGADLPQALISRSVAGVINETQVFALPGSVKAAREYMNEILRVLEHNMLMLWGIDAH
ncbi:MAG: MOSC domain-containing protein [Deltaproteobacteria bacterium]|nr:MOSC domain-containing protein [Deltaproteobacteria bacterium]